MTQSYILILKSKNIFSSTITKLLLFQNIDDAYNYGLNLDLQIDREIIYTLDKVIQNKILWTSNKNTFPYYTCKIYPILNDDLCNIYQNVKVSNNATNAYMIKEIYKNIKIYGLI